MCAPPTTPPHRIPFPSLTELAVPVRGSAAAAQQDRSCHHVRVGRVNPASIRLRTAEERKMVSPPSRRPPGLGLMSLHNKQTAHIFEMRATQRAAGEEMRRNA